MAFLFADAGLARKLEAAEVAGGLAVVRALREQYGAGAAHSEPVGGGVAVFCGPDSSLNRASGVGLTQAVTTADIDRMEAFFVRFGAVPVVEVCPLADPALADLLARRGYCPSEYSNVLSCLIEPNESRPKLVACADRELWARIMLQGVVEREDLDADQLEAGRLVFDTAATWLAEFDGEPVGAGAMAIREEVAVLFADSTLPGFRRRGAHLRLIWGRLRDALEQGITIAMTATLPGSGSQRNYERCGFRVAYTRIVMTRY